MNQNQTQTENTRASIGELVELIDSNQAISEDQYQQIMDRLEEFECWAPFFRLIKRRLSSKRPELSDYVKLARIQNQYLEDVFEAAETCAQAVDKLHLNFSAVIEQVLPFVVDPEDFSTEAMILDAVSKKFQRKSDEILCLERICVLYEKKIFNEAKLNEYYQILINSDPKNVKALRYFKLVYTQNYEWSKVVEVLQSLLEVSQHPHDLYRLSQELAAVYLYQLDDPAKAIEIIVNYCESSPLDTSIILFDAYQRLGDWNGCLKVLRECLLGVDSDESRAILHFKIGRLEERLENIEAAIKSFKRASWLNPAMLEAQERLIYLLAQSKKWEDILIELDLLVEKVSKASYKQALDQLKRRLNEGLELKHANV